ncbi:hypothetical protein P170DRAFT_475615 [Aspergillus steynii IBT 23096]|uniref:Uncharacterized protein n=1 Tax=Aspergillus steynii IBT 23096 TaxID=1392250 RepID=A0A2I2G8W6_9EURO|nr:uncharacterized protein P170DRAFT_475615 [Aspergillus steynii IBT 23096]PLB49319.1 hypothetical protein P170DRAFT_475615 [Aspergillus steynii IBT 23096]
MPIAIYLARLPHSRHGRSISPDPARILQGEDIGHGKNGYFLAASGHVHWNDVYQAMASALAKRNAIDDDVITQADEDAMARMGEALGVSPSAVPVLLGGMCRFTADHGGRIGWTPKYGPSHILEAADEEVELILGSLDSGEKQPIR